MLNIFTCSVSGFSSMLKSSVSFPRHVQSVPLNVSQNARHPLKIFPVAGVVPVSGTLVCERKNELLEGLFFLFFLFHKNYIGMTWDGQEENVPPPAAHFYRQYLKPEILI